MSTTLGYNASAYADAQAYDCEEAENGDVVYLNEFARFPQVGFAACSTTFFNNEIAGADLSDASPSEHGTCDEPCEASAADWTADAVGQSCKRP